MPSLSLQSVQAVLLLSTDDASRILTKYYPAPHQNAPNPSAGSSGAAGSSSSGAIGSLASDYISEPPYKTVKEQKAFEKGLFAKTLKRAAGDKSLGAAAAAAGDNDVVLYDDHVVVYKVESDVAMYVVGSSEENEILLYNTVVCLRDSLNLLLR